MPHEHAITYRDRHHPLRDGRWDSEIIVQRWEGGVFIETPVIPGENVRPFATREEAKAYNVFLFETVRRLRF
jgi:hypothetical protein